MIFSKFADELSSKSQMVEDLKLHSIAVKDNELDELNNKLAQSELPRAQPGASHKRPRSDEPDLVANQMKNDDLVNRISIVLRELTAQMALETNTKFAIIEEKSARNTRGVIDPSSRSSSRKSIATKTTHMTHAECLNSAAVPQAAIRNISILGTNEQLLHTLNTFQMDDVCSGEQINAIKQKGKYKFAVKCATDDAAAKERRRRTFQ